MAAQGEDFSDLYSVRWSEGIDPRLAVQAPTSKSITTSAPGRNASVMLKSCMYRDEDFSKVKGIPRAEVAFVSVPRFSLGFEYEIHWSIYLPEDYKFDSKQPEIITQIHQSVNYGSPPLSLMLSGNRYRVEIRGGAGASSYVREFGDPSADLGRLVEWSLRYRPDASGRNSLVDIYKNGNLILHVEGFPNSYSDESRAYLKLGLYKWWWLSRPSDVQQRCVYYGDVNVRSRRSD